MLEEAEKLAAASYVEARRRASWLVQLAAAEAQCAASLAGREELARRQRHEQGIETQRLAGLLRAVRDEQLLLGKRLASLQRELDFAEAEVIQTKTRLKGPESKAEASSAIAEASILIGRLQDDPRGRHTLARAQDAVVRAEELMEEGHYGAAIFFARKAQDTALRAAPDEQPAPTQQTVELPPPYPTYTVRVARANLRSGPSLSSPVVAQLDGGTRITATAMHGTWVKVTVAGDEQGWVLASLLE